VKQITIIGNGNMAFAIAQGLSKEYRLQVVGRSLEKLKEFESRLGVEVEIVSDYLDTSFDISGRDVILAVKPNNLSSVAKSLSGKANSLLSVLAGTTLLSLKEKIEAESYIRAMPNLSASFQKSMTSITGNPKDREFAEEIFSYIGTTLWLDSESDIDIATAIAGSGPAYLSLVAEALADGGVKAGLKRRDAETLVHGLFNGFAPLIENKKASVVKDEVMSPKGTTAYGYSALEEGRVRTAFIKAVESAFNRAVELGK
jgi:pyrroline-5-carboxylate reductase